MTIEIQVARLGELSGPALVVLQNMDDLAVSAMFGEMMRTILTSTDGAYLFN